MTVQPNDIIRVDAKMQGTPSDGEFVNSYHFQATGASVDDATVIAALRAKMQAAYTDLFSAFPPDVESTTIAIYNITQDTKLDESAWPTPWVGAATGTSLPYQCAPLVLFSTAALRSQGRKFLPPVSENRSDAAGEITGTLVIELAAYAAEIIASSVINAGATVLQAGNWSPTLQRFAVWLGIIVSNYIKTQRRRGVGVGS